MSVAYKTTNITITSGEQVSDQALDLKEGAVVGILLPATITSTALTFLGCDTPDGTFLDVYTRDGSPYSVTVAASHYIVIPPADLAGIRYIKVKMGSAEGGDRVIRVIERWV